jgi:hypothetical protein
MNFEMNSKATKEQIDATIKRGLEALVEAHANGRPANVALMFEGDLPAKGDKPAVSEDDSKEEDEDETRLTLESPSSRTTNAKFAKTILVCS